MENPSENKIRLSVYIANWLKNQVDFWLKNQIVSPTQAANIKNLYIWPEEKPSQVPQEKHPIRLIAVLQTIGAFLIGIGVISLVAFNWSKLLNVTKLVIIVSALVLAHFSGFFILTFRPKMQRCGSTFIFLGNLLYGAGIWLVAQMYHIHHTFPTGVFLWALGIIPFAYILRSKLNYFLAIALFILWTLGESIGYQRPHLLFLLVLGGLMGPLSYYLKSKVGLAICIISAGTWLLVNNILWFGSDISIYLFFPLALYALFLVGASNAHLLRNNLWQYRKIYLFTGIAVFSVVVFLLPLFGVMQSEFISPSLSSLSLSFWICSVVLLGGVIFCIRLTSGMQLDESASLVRKMMLSLFAASLYILAMPTIKHSLLLTLFPVAIVALAYWHYTKSRLLIHLSLVYIIIWLPFCLVQWKQVFVLFFLFLLYGAFCYILGWTYLSRFQAVATGNLFKAFGLTVGFFSLYIFSFSSLSEYFAGEYAIITDSEFWIITIFLYLVIFFLYTQYLSTFYYPSHKKGMLPEERVAAPILFITPMIIFIEIANKFTGTFYTLFINFLTLSLLIAFLAAGYRRKQVSLKVISFLFLALLVGTRYLEIEWSLLYKSLLFIVTGIIVLAVGIIIERNKEKVVVINE
ncbi:MAG: DUF2157 domain-containing protein [Candidatus Omnitrophota bacterium]|nr:MAG: DUF2157 domain-containing protein [Candidatus Omnitrophota bacterium]